MNRPKLHVALLALLLAGFIAVGCRPAVSREEQAMQAAVDIYHDLLQGRYDNVVAQRADYDHFPKAFRGELTEAVAQSHHRMEHTDHGRISVVKPGHANFDSVGQQMMVFLIIEYADSVAEEILVPMVERDGQWLLK